jgi:hypothetical protein
LFVWDVLVPRAIYPGNACFSLSIFDDGTVCAGFRESEAEGALARSVCEMDFVAQIRHKCRYRALKRAVPLPEAHQKSILRKLSASLWRKLIDTKVEKKFFTNPLIIVPKCTTLGSISPGAIAVR